jgi:hypothetical protein
VIPWTEVLSRRTPFAVSLVLTLPLQAQKQRPRSNPRN